VGVFVLAAIVLFIYMGAAIGTFSFDGTRYNAYTFVYADVTGLACKSEVKIAGVKVGWVKNIHLAGSDGSGVQVEVSIDKQYHLYENARAMVRQDGLLGPYYLEVVPGDPELSRVPPDAFIDQCHHTAVSINSTLHAVQDVATDLRTLIGSLQQAVQQPEGNRVGQLLDDVHRTAQQVTNEFLPTCSDGVAKLKHALNTDVKHFIERVERAAGSFQTVTDSIGHAFKRFEQLEFVFDGHVEHMFRRAENYCHRDTKGIFNTRIFVNPEYFYLVGVTTSQKGYIRRETTFKEYSDDCLNEICPRFDELPEWAKYAFIYNTSRQEVKRDAWKVDLQFGKCFSEHLALRIGLIEGTAGVAADINCPMGDQHRMIATFKIYDFRGRIRLNDPRPHLKLIARLFLFEHVYLAFGIDDFVSKCNASFFLGAGFRFGDTDMKYFVPNYVGT
jgi:phospholipid/cholesterol/gamma-HCH transport system substrate-binding protein